MRRYIIFFSIITLASCLYVLHSVSRARTLPPPETSRPATAKPVKASFEPPGKPLKNPPETIKAVYLTSWGASSTKKVDYIIDLISTTELNSVVIDIKDYSGYVTYDIEIPEVEKYGSRERRIRNINGLIKKFHREGIYVIGRISVFQDPILAGAEPGVSVHSRQKVRAMGRPSGKTLWLDDKGLAWVDPASRLAWDYNIAIAKDAAARGFDEINFDYIRFPSDGNLDDMHFPAWDGKTPKREVMKAFFKYLRANLRGVSISGDLFGLSTVAKGDLEIGQMIEDAYEHFDYVCPMVYPSHFGAGFLGYTNPAKYPYEVVKYSVGDAVKRLEAFNGPEKTGRTAKLRPWLQDFDLGAVYEPSMVRAQIEALDRTPDKRELLNGWMFWDPKNLYTKEAFLLEREGRAEYSLQ